MEERHEIIEFPRNLSMKIFMHRIGSVNRHWHRSLELLFLLEGSARVGMDGKSFDMAEGDVVLINSNSIHELHSTEGAVLVALQIKPDLFRINNTFSDESEYACNSALDEHAERYDALRMCIARMLLENLNKDNGTAYRNYGLSYWLLAELASHFRAPDNGLPRMRQKYTQRLTAILDYVEQHYAENFSLADLADSQQLSVPYLSSFFSKYIGVKFSQYYTDVKLDHALHELTNTDHAVERIAASNGFPEPHTFIRAFKAKFGDTPNSYRKKESARRLALGGKDDLNYLSLEPSNYLSVLEKYTHGRKLVDTPTAIYPAEHIFVSEVHVDSPLRHLQHTFKNVITVGRARDLLSHDIRVMLQDIQSTVGYKYIKFHGILSDDMMVCVRMADGSLQFRFHMVDSALEYLLSIGLKPIIQLSFMPTALASDPDKTIFCNPFNTSPPRDMGEWNLLIKNFVQHLIAQFGRDEVISWPFCVWCEPETSTKMFGFGNHALFCEFYQNTYDTVKSVCGDIRFGSPAFLYMREQGDPQFLIQFLNYTLSHNCRPDFMNTHYYADIIPRKAVDMNISNALSSRLPRETDAFSHFITEIRDLFKKYGVGDLPIYLTEWNLTLSHRNLISDTCFKACYILKNLLENYDRLDSFGYWSLTDLLEENPLPESGNIFHGGLGIYTMNGTRKSVFYAFDFANRLGDELLAQGEGYFVTRKNGRIQIITYNYIHYGDLFAAGDAVGVTNTERYAPFDMSHRITPSIPLTGLSSGQYKIKEYFVNRENGSAFDLWVRAGGLPLSSTDTKLYQNTCVPGFHVRLVDCENNFFTYSPTLEPLEIRFTEISPVNG